MDIELFGDSANRLLKSLDHSNVWDETGEV